MGIYVFLIFLISSRTMYFSWVNTEQTPGKMAVKLRIVRPPIDPKSLIGGRLLAYFAQALTNCHHLSRYIMAAFDSEKRALHDYICDTRVVKRDA